MQNIEGFTNEAFGKKIMNNHEQLIILEKTSRVFPLRFLERRGISKKGTLFG